MAINQILMKEKEFYRIIVIGPKGAGKSQFCNFIMRDTKNETFEVSVSLDQCTQAPNSKFFERNKTKYEIIDTVGYGDTAINDEKNLKSLILFLKEKKTIDSICLILNFNQRLSGPSRDYLKFLGRIFTPWEFYSHLCVFFTKSPVKPNKKEKKIQKIYIEEINKILKETFQVPKNLRVPEVKVFFIDTEYDEDEQKYEELFQDTVDIMLKYMKLNIYRYNSIDTSKLDVEGKRTQEYELKKCHTTKFLTNFFEKQNKIYELEKEIEKAKQANDTELVKQKEEELNEFKKSNTNIPELKLDKEKEEEFKKMQEIEEKCLEIEKKIDEEALSKNIHVEDLDDVVDKYAEISKKLGIGGAATFLLGLGGIAASTICPIAGPIIASVCFTGSGGFTLGSIGYKIASLVGKKK